ncbi:uncharacterized protein LOC129229707 [Uloborus diversus]|uniref:uncharacterized protein LOC129229707 n=1 Tax=Uloborus diversus TaxID=327109 RepID=UPI002409B5BD|nr:uncharacterized protein LOC129229707 [Uloborus diversus]
MTLLVNDFLQVIIFCLLATVVVSNPIGPEEDDDDIPVYTEKVSPAKPTAAARRVPQFGEKKISPKVASEKLALDRKRPYSIQKQTTSVPKAVLKTTKPILSNSRPVRRIPKVRTDSFEAERYNGIMKGEYNAPKVSYAPSPELGVEYDVPDRSISHGLIDDYEPRRPAPELRSAVGNAPRLRYAVAPRRLSAAAAQVRDVPHQGYNDLSHADGPPQPYLFGFELRDEDGSTQSRREQGDAQGNKRGSYGYRDGYGIYREVEYVADEHGFRAVVKTNEPGTRSEDPADVQMLSEAEKQ